MVGTTNVDTEYTARFVLPDLIERGIANTLRCPLYLDGALVAPSSGTISIYDASNTAQVSGASATITGSVATYSYSPSASLTLGDNWRVEYTLTVSGATVYARNDAALVRARLRNPVTDADLYSRMSSLNPSNQTVIHSLSDLQDYLDASWQEIQRRLINKGRRPWLAMSPSSFYDASLWLALSLIFDDFATRLNEAYAAQAATFRERYEAAWRELTFRYDESDSGQADAARRRSANPTIWLCGRG